MAAAHRRILVIDDDHDVADSFGMLLEAYGANVRVAYSGDEGLKAIEDFRPEVVFLDIGMPHMDGCETARRIRALPVGRNVKIVALTGWGPKQVDVRVGAAGFDHHLTKPASPEEFGSFLD